MMTTAKLITSDDPKGRRATDTFRAMYDKAGLIDGADGSAQFLNENREFPGKLLNLINECSTNSRSFKLLIDLGIVTVPGNYVHGEQLDSLNRNRFYYFDEFITDANFSNPTRILKPGDKFWVCVFEQIAPGRTTSEERIAFLATKKTIYVGAQGISLVFEQKHNQLPKGRWYESFDEKEHLWKDSAGFHRMPHICADSNGSFSFSLGSFVHGWGATNCLLCFREIPT